MLRKPVGCRRNGLGATGWALGELRRPVGVGRQVFMEAMTMPAKSKAQQMAAGAALSAKRGEKKKSELKGASKSMVESMSKKQLEELASTDRKKLPSKKKS